MKDLLSEIFALVDKAPGDSATKLNTLWGAGKIAQGLMVMENPDACITRLSCPAPELPTPENR